MKCQILFVGKNKKENISVCRLLKIHPECYALTQYELELIIMKDRLG